MNLAAAMALIEPAYAMLSRACDERGARLIAVVKRQPDERVLAAYHLGLRHFAHNYLQEGMAQRLRLHPQMPLAEWHFIGRIQSNKTRDLSEGWHRLHSVDRLKVALRLGAPEVLVQVRLGGEHSKAGIDPGELFRFLESLRSGTDLRLRGLMALPPPRPFWGGKNPFFELARLRDEAMRLGLLATDGGELSMGTSEDHAEALLAGSTWLRVGSALLGQRYE